MKHSLGIFIFGLVAGLLIGFVIFGGDNKQPALSSPATENSKTVNAVATTAASPDFNQTKILVDKIETVPFQELYGLLAQRRPNELAELAAQLGDLPADRRSTAKLSTFFKAWAHLDPNAAFRSAITLKTTAARSTAIGAIIEGADPAAAGSLATSLNKLGPDVVPNMEKAEWLAQAVTKWSQIDPAAAAKLSDTLQVTGMNFTLARYSVAQNWAATDPASAIAWAESHADGSPGIGMSAMSGAVAGWWQKDHAAAEAYVSVHVNDPDAQQLVYALAGEIARDNPKNAMAWLNQLPNEQMKKEGAMVIASQWAISDPKSASAWAATLQPAQMETPIAASMSFWAQTDPRAAAQWAQTLRGPARDYAFGTYGITVARRDPVNGLSWAENISQPNLRDRYRQQIVTDWLNRDTNAARAWIQNSSLSPDEKERLLKLKPGS